MAAAQTKVAGLVSFYVAGIQLRAKSAIEYNINPVKREVVMGADGPHGYKEMPQPQFVRVTLTDTSDLDTRALFALKDVPVHAVLPNGKVVGLRDGFFAGDGTVNTEESEISCEWQGFDGFELQP